MVRPTPVRILALILFLSAAAAGRDIVLPELRAAMMAAAPGARLPAYVVMADQLPGPELERLARGLHRRARRATLTQVLQEHASASQRDVRTLLDAAQAAGQAGAVSVLWMGNAVLFEAEPAIIGIVNPNSPLVWDFLMVDAMWAWAEANQPIAMTPFLLAGATAPVSLGR